MTWDGAIKKQLQKLNLSELSGASSQQLDDIYENIANGATRTFGADKGELGESFKKFFIDRLPQNEYTQLLKILDKYRMLK